MNKDLFGGISQRVELIRDKLEVCQGQLLRGIDIARNSGLEQELLHEFTSISNAEEAFFKQTSRNKWLNLGDQNNTYFHNLVKVRQANQPSNVCWMRMVEGLKIQRKLNSW